MAEEGPSIPKLLSVDKISLPPKYPPPPVEGLSFVLRGGPFMFSKRLSWE